MFKYGKTSFKNLWMLWKHQNRCKFLPRYRNTEKDVYLYAFASVYIYTISLNMQPFGVKLLWLYIYTKQVYIYAFGVLVHLWMRKYTLSNA